MKIVSCRKGIELAHSQSVKILDNEIILNILGTDSEINLDYIPSIPYGVNNKIYYTQIGACIYIGIKDVDNYMIFLYVIEQEIKNNKINIKNIYSDTIVDEKNILARFFRYDRNFENENLKNRLVNVIKQIPVIIESDYLQNKIIEYLNNQELQDIEGIEEATLEEISKPHFTKQLTNTSDKKGENVGLSEEKKAIKKGGYMEGRKITYNGKEYNSIYELSKFVDIPLSTLTRRINKGETVEEIVKTYEALRRYNGTINRHNIGKEIVCNGVKFKSITEFREKFNIARSTVTLKLLEGYTPEEIVEKYGGGLRKYSNRKRKAEPRKLDKFKYLDQEMTLDELSELSGIPRKVIYDRIYVLNWDIAKAIETPVREKNKK